MSEQQHQSDPAILDRRTLQSDHRALAAILAPGMSVLDVGCGTGSITEGIAEAVGPNGRVVGLDRDTALIERARQRPHGLPNLRFEIGDAANFAMEQQFDVVTSARTLQWIQHAGAAIASLARAARPGGRVLVLDYSHALNTWEPDPPPSFRAFYQAFLDWRSANGWDNNIGNRLPELFEQAGLTSIEAQPQSEVAVRGDGSFTEATALWTGVLDSIAPNLQASGYCTADQLHEARREYEDWRLHTLRRQELSITAVVGTVPAGH